MAGNLGMYIITIVESDDDIKVDAPAGGVGRW